jgi:hypothetical protein
MTTKENRIDGTFEVFPEVNGVRLELCIAMNEIIPPCPERFQKPRKILTTKHNKKVYQCLKIALKHHFDIQKKYKPYEIGNLRHCFLGYEFTYEDINLPIITMLQKDGWMVEHDDGLTPKSDNPLDQVITHNPRWLICNEFNLDYKCRTCYYRKQDDHDRCDSCKRHLERRLYIEGSTYGGVGIPLDASLGFQVHGRYLSESEKKLCGCSICVRELAGDIIV